MSSILQGLVPNTQEEGENCQQCNWLDGLCSIVGRVSSFFLYFLSSGDDKPVEGINIKHLSYFALMFCILYSAVSETAQKNTHYLLIN